MEIDTRFPTVQANQSQDARDGETPAPPQAALVGSGSESEFYVSPVLRFDSRSLTVLFQVRDSRTGDVVRQFPPEAVVERYRQDPATKPFVVATRAAGGDDGQGVDGQASDDVDLLAPLPTGEADALTAQQAQPTPATDEAPLGPVNLVA